MRISFSILACTASLLLFVALATGFVSPSTAAEREIYSAKHVLAGVCTMLFACFVHVLAFTYFVVCARMAKEAVQSAGLERAGYEQINRLKRRAIGWLLVGVVPLLAAGVLGALA